MANLKEEINLRSEEVQDIMSKLPNRIIQYGISVIFALIILGLFLTWIIKYPEIIKGQISITTSSEPLKMLSQTSGTLTKIYVNDGEFVKKGTILAEIENPVSAGSLNLIQLYLIKLSKSLSQGANQLPILDTTTIVLGDLQVTVNRLSEEILIYNSIRKFKTYVVENASLIQKISNQKELIRINEKIIAITKKELENAKVEYNANIILYQDSMISQVEFYQKESNFRNKELTLERLYQSNLDMRNMLAGLELERSQAEFNNFSKTQNNLEILYGSIKSINGFIFGWKQKYNLVAMGSGTVNYLQLLHNGTYTKVGEVLFAITNPENSYKGIIRVPFGGYGKIKLGQSVNVLLSSFPYYEYGMLIGQVKKIAIFPNTNEYRIEISFPKGMLSNTNTMLQYSPEMTGEAEIITEDKRALHRIFDSLIKALKRK